MSTSSLVENWDTDALIVYLRGRNLRLEQNDFSILRTQKIDGQVFLEMTEEKFMQDGLERGPAVKLAKEAKALKDNKLLSKEKWTGYYASYSSQPLVASDESSMDIELIFSPSNPDKVYNLSVDTNDKVVKEFSGSGKDQTGNFIINNGVVTDKGRVHFVKKYSSHSWNYNGKWLSVGICGMWGTSSGCGGNFLIWKV